MDTPEITQPPVLQFHCWGCRQPFPSDALVIFTAALPEELWPRPADDGHYQAKVGLAYLCPACTVQGLALTRSDVHTAFDAPTDGKDTPVDEFLPTPPPEPAHVDPV